MDKQSGTQQRMIETAPGVCLSVQVAGDGPLVILMHGWPELGLSWRHQVPALVAAGYRVAVPDMRGYGRSSQPGTVNDYGMDALADDMAAIAAALGHPRWAAVGHDWGAPVAWRSALRFPDAVAAVFGLSVPHGQATRPEQEAAFRSAFSDRFYYVRYFQDVGPAEAELERDPRAALRKIFFALSGDAPLHEWVKLRSRDADLLSDLVDPPAGPLSFMSEDELDLYAQRYGESGFFGGLNWYRNVLRNAREAWVYGEQRITQAAGFLCGDKEITLAMIPGGLDRQRLLCDDLRCETVLPGAGHWIQQERPVPVSAALTDFLDGVRAEGRFDGAND